jgi:hypothetical protein
MCKIIIENESNFFSFRTDLKKLRMDIKEQSEKDRRAENARLLEWKLIRERQVA